MRSIDSTARAIDALIQTGAHDVAADMLRVDLIGLVTHSGLDRVRQWCATLRLTELVDVQAALARAHEVREASGVPAIAAFESVAALAAAADDPVAEFQALAEVYVVGLLLWAGFREMQAHYERIEQLYAAHGPQLGAHDALACLPGLLAARVLLAETPQHANLVGERVVELAHDDGLPRAARLRAATVLQAWIVFTGATDRVVLLDQALSELPRDESIPASIRVMYRAAHALTISNRIDLLKAAPGARIDTAALLRDADALQLQWLRFFTTRAVQQFASRSARDDAASLLNELEAIVDPAERTQVLAVQLRRGLAAIYQNDYARGLASSRRCMELVEALEIGPRFAGVYREANALALIGLALYDDALATIAAALESCPPAYRRLFLRVRSFALLAQAIDRQQQARMRGEDDDGVVCNLLAVHLESVDGRLSKSLALTHPQHLARVAAAAFECGTATEAIAEDVRSLGLSPPLTRPVSWPWLLRIRMFDGYVCEGIVGGNESGRKGDSKSAQLMQYLAAFAPASVPAQRLADALWPEAEGDRAMRSLDVALTRLRATLPDASLVTRQDGRIGLDMRRVWCDTAAALQLMDDLEARSGVEAAQAALRLLELYRGPLLPDSREPFAHERATHFRARVADAAQRGVRAAAELGNAAPAMEILRRVVARGLPVSLATPVIAELSARGGTAAARAVEFEQLLHLLRR